MLFLYKHIYFPWNGVLKFWKSRQWLSAACWVIYSLLHLTGQLFVLQSVLVCLKWDRPATSMLRGCFEFLETFFIYLILAGAEW